MKKIPTGWIDFKPYGDKVEGTKLLPFKTPLKKELVEKKIPEEQWFTPTSLTANFPHLKAIIDLTDTRTVDRYYNPKEFVDANVEHLKIRIPGGALVPGMDKIRSFSDAVDRFVEKFSDNPDALIGVHCTHGLNRTGYLICKYMVMKMFCEPKDAIAKFQKARGYEMYRQNFIDEIMSPGSHTRMAQKPNYRRPTYRERPMKSGNSHQTNWRSRDPESVSMQEPNWKSFRTDNRTRRNEHELGPSTSHRPPFHQRASNSGNREYSRRDMEYRSPLEDDNEDGFRTVSYRSRFQRNRNGRT